VFDALPDRLLPAARRATVLLRLAALLHRAHETDPIPRLVAGAEGDRLSVSLDRAWLEARPLLATDLEGEPEDVARLGVELVVDAA
jgi:exopolyphosphatase/guanosine-5'-triphosphate,3'-diphosphate pyrophosphatase